MSWGPIPPFAPGAPARLLADWNALRTNLAVVGAAVGAGTAPPGAAAITVGSPAIAYVQFVGTAFAASGAIPLVAPPGVGRGIVYRIMAHSTGYNTGQSAMGWLARPGSGSVSATVYAITSPSITGLLTLNSAGALSWSVTGDPSMAIVGWVVIFV